MFWVAFYKDVTWQVAWREDNKPLSVTANLAKLLKMLGVFGLCHILINTDTYAYTCVLFAYLSFVALNIYDEQKIRCFLGAGFTHLIRRLMFIHLHSLCFCFTIFLFFIFHLPHSSCLYSLSSSLSRSFWPFQYSDDTWFACTYTILHVQCLQLKASKRGCWWVSMCSPIDIKRSSDMEMGGQRKNGFTLRLCLDVGQGLLLLFFISVYLYPFLSLTLLHFWDLPFSLLLFSAFTVSLFIVPFGFLVFALSLTYVKHCLNL